MTLFKSEVVLQGHAFSQFVESPAPTVRAAGKVVKSLSSWIAETYHRCNPNFRYSAALNPRRILTKPPEGVSNDGYDNVNADYILRVNDVLVSGHGQKYIVLELLGEGTFGQVVKCQQVDSKELYAIKIVKNKPAYFNQAVVEIRILQMLNRYYDADEQHHIVRLFDAYMFRNHLCIVCELLNVNLYELLKQNKFHGLSTKLLRAFGTQLLQSLSVLSDAKVIHCDLKPENILLKNLHSPEIKLIDFGSACFEGQTVYMYLQSRFYRSPEVLLGLSYTSAIDIWSLGCIAAELFLGLPLFPGSSEFNQMFRIVDMLGSPPDRMLNEGKTATKFFKKVDAPTGSTWVMKTDAEYAKENNVPIEKPKKYFNFRTLDEIIEKYPYKKNLSEEQIKAEKESRRAFLHLLKGLLNLDPTKRWTAKEAGQHPFVTGATFAESWVPPPREDAGFPYGAKSRPRAIVSNPRRMDHTQGPQHRWLGDPQSAPLHANATPSHQLSTDQSAAWASTNRSRDWSLRGPRLSYDSNPPFDSRGFNPGLLHLSRSADGRSRTPDERGNLVHVLPSGQPYLSTPFGSPAAYPSTPIACTPPQRARNKATIPPTGNVAGQQRPGGPNHLQSGHSGSFHRAVPVPNSPKHAGVHSQQHLHPQQHLHMNVHMAPDSPADRDRPRAHSYSEESYLAQGPFGQSRLSVDYSQSRHSDYTQHRHTVGSVDETTRARLDSMRIRPAPSNLSVAVPFGHDAPPNVPASQGQAPPYVGDSPSASKPRAAPILPNPIVYDPLSPSVLGITVTSMGATPSLPAGALPLPSTSPIVDSPLTNLSSLSRSFGHRRWAPAPEPTFQSVPEEGGPWRPSGARGGFPVPPARGDSPDIFEAEGFQQDEEVAYSNGGCSSETVTSWTSASLSSSPRSSRGADDPSILLSVKMARAGHSLPNGHGHPGPPYMQSWMSVHSDSASLSGSGPVTIGGGGPRPEYHEDEEYGGGRPDFYGWQRSSYHGPESHHNLESMYLADLNSAQNRGAPGPPAAEPFAGPGIKIPAKNSRQSHPNAPQTRRKS